ncbi:MAG: hypothetical protein JNJ60_09820 [Rhodocyclaceae bacterium]|nr:hypothetical protein [Rhodocyclaceae bacterium]
MKLAPRTTLLLIAAICVLPFLGSTLAYKFWRPDTTINYGELVTPRPLPAATLPAPDGGKFDTASLRGRWVLVQVDEASCDERCRYKLYSMRQVRAAVGKDMTRIERLWLMPAAGRPDEELLRAVPGMQIAAAPSADMQAWFAPATELRDHIWLVDPLGNVMMRYPARPDGKAMIRDIERLLKYSRAG